MRFFAKAGTKILLLSVLLILILMPLSCNYRQESGKIKIVCTVFSGYDWVQNIIKGHEENFDIVYLLSNGSDSHSYQPTVKDIALISDCNLLISSGGESEEWVLDAVESSGNDDIMLISMLDIIGDRALDEYAGIQSGRHEGHDHHGDEEEYDEHTWLSLKNAVMICSEIERIISGIDPKNSDSYMKNRDEYCRRLDELFEKYKDSIKNSQLDTLIFADRFPFAYLMDDLGISYHAAFSGCSAESEASVETIVKLTELTRSVGCEYICVIETSDKKLAETVSSCVGNNCRIITLDSIQAVSDKKIKNGYNYIDVMENNLKLIKRALSISE